MPLVREKTPRLGEKVYEGPRVYAHRCCPLLLTRVVLLGAGTTADNERWYVRHLQPRTLLISGSLKSGYIPTMLRQSMGGM